MLQFLRRELKFINDVLICLMAYHIQVGFACKQNNNLVLTPLGLYILISCTYLFITKGQLATYNVIQNRKVQ